MVSTFREARWYRSMLYVPGHKPDWMLKAPKYGADALVFDLEDSVEVAEKPAARNSVARAVTELRTGRYGRFVRVNGWRTGHLLDDLDSVVVDGLDGVILAMAEDPGDVVALDLVLGELEKSRGLPVGKIEICPSPETAAAMYRRYDLYMASPRVKRGGGVDGPTPGGDGFRALGLPLNDVSGDQGIYFGAYSLLQARAAGIQYVEGGMTAQLDDLELVRRICERSKRMGASCGSAIHPSHIPVINEVYSPSHGEIDNAREVVSAMAEAVARGEGAVRHGSSMVDYATVRVAMDLLHRAQSVGIDVGYVPKVELPN